MLSVKIFNCLNKRAEVGTEIKEYPWYGRKDPVIIIYRSQILRLKQFPKPTRDQLVIELATDMGLRSGEISSLRIENIDVASGRSVILDSKKREPYPIPLTYELAQLIEKAKAGRREGWLILQDKRCSWRRGPAMSTIGLCWIWKKWARKAGISNWRKYNPRLGRHYFAAEWSSRGGNVEILRRILRHTSLQTTQIYLSRLLFFEDEEKEYRRIMQIPNLVETQSNVAEAPGACDHKELCKHYEGSPEGCIHRTICKHFVQKNVSVPKPLAPLQEGVESA